MVDAHAFNRLSFYGERGATIESLTVSFRPTRIWTYGDFLRQPPTEGDEMVQLNLRMRGGWQATAQVRRAFVLFDRAAYRSYTVENASGVRLPFDPPANLSGLIGTTVTATTPILQALNANIEVQRAEVPVFLEAEAGQETRIIATANVRPTGSIRIELSHTYSRITRERDASEFARTILPRFRVDVQPRRSLFVRVVAEYRAQRQSTLIDPRTGAPLFVDGVRLRPEMNGLRADWLFSYEPTPGTVVFVGYGASLETPRTLSLRGLERTNDGFFVKLAYLFRR
jgi:hypothetical protein